MSNACPNAETSLRSANKEPPARKLSENTSEVYITSAVLKKLNYFVYITPNIIIWSKLTLFLYLPLSYTCVSTKWFALHIYY